MADLTNGLPTLDNVITAPSYPKAQQQANDAQDVLDRTILKGTMDNMANQTQLIQQTQQQATKAYADIEAERLRLRQLQAKQADAERLPRFVQKIGGLFDPEMNPDYLAGQVRESAGVIDDKAFQLQSMTNISDMQSKLFSQQLEIQNKQYGMLSDQVSRALNLRKSIDEEQKYQTALSFKYSEERRANAAESRSVEAEKRAAEEFARNTKAYNISRIDDSVLRSALSGNNKDITTQEAQAELQRREANALSLSNAKSQETRAATAAQQETTKFQWQQQAHQTALLTEPELEAALAGKNPTIPVPMAKDEKIRRDMQSAQLQGVQNALEMDKIQHDAASDALIAQRKLAFMASMNPNELQTLADDAKRNGGKATYQGVDFTTREISAAQTTLLAESKAQQKTVLDAMNAQQGWKDNVNEIDRITLNMAEAQGDAKVIAQNHAMLVADLNKINNAVAIGAHEEALKASEEALKKVNDRKEQVINTYPEAQRPFVRSRIEGLQPDTGQALAFIGVAGLDRTALNRSTGGPYGEIYKRWSDAERAQLKGQGLPSNATQADIMTFMMNQSGGGQPKWDQLAAQTFSSGDFTAVFQDQRDVGAMNDALAELAKLNPVFNGLDVRKFTSQEVDQQTGLPVTVLQGTQLMAHLRQRWDDDVQRGFVKLHEPGPSGLPQVSYDQQFIQFLNSQQFQRSVYDKWTQGLDMKTYAFSELLHGGNPMTGYSGMVQVMNSNFQQYYAQLLQQKQQAITNLQSPENMTAMGAGAAYRAAHPGKTLFGIGGN